MPKAKFEAREMKRAFAFSFVIVIATAGAVGLKAFINSSRTLEADLHRRIDQRAQLNLFEDFQKGLDFWEGPQPIGSTWSYDASGLVIPGELSFFKPSMQLTDYDVETWAEIVNKCFAIVFRAAGPRSYHALKFTSQSSSRKVYIAGERYTVIDGKTSARHLIHGPIPVGEAQPCHIRLQARGDSFTLYVDGQLVDYWSDSRLKSGGVGLFCGPGERARIMWMRVSHQTDLAGKLCALVSAFSTETSQE
jgi:hypothetical protein